MEWWPTFKRDLQAQCRAAQRRYRAAAEPGAAAAARRTLELLYEELDAGASVDLLSTISCWRCRLAG